MTPPRDLDATVVARYFSGESTPAESALVEAWLASDSRRRTEFEEIRRAWSASFPLERPIDVDSAWKQMAPRLREIDTAPAMTDKSNQNGGIRLDRAGTDGNGRRSMSARTGDIHGAAARRDFFNRSSGSRGNSNALRAAAITLLMLGSAGAYRYLGVSGSTADHARVVREFAAAPGQRAIIDLVDGTHIVLAPSTHLKFSAPARGVGLREAVLEGEATFTVTHDSARPFVVRSQYGNTTDIGTSFAVRAYPDAPYRVAVREGRVALGDAHHAQSAILIAGDVAVRGKDGELQVTHGRDVAQMLDWSSGRLTFDHRRFAELVPDLERWYGVKIRIASPVLRNRIISGQFDTESRNEVFNALGRALGARHTVDGSAVTFSMP